MEFPEVVIVVTRKVGVSMVRMIVSSGVRSTEDAEEEMITREGEREKDASVLCHQSQPRQALFLYGRIILITLLMGYHTSRRDEQRERERERMMILPIPPMNHHHGNTLIQLHFLPPQNSFSPVPPPASRRLDPSEPWHAESGGKQDHE